MDPEKEKLFFVKYIKSIVEAFPDIYFLLDTSGTILDFKAGPGAKLYMPPEGFLGKQIYSVLPPDVGKRMKDCIARVGEANMASSMEYALSILGNKLFFEARFMPLADGQILAVVRDITELKRAEEALQGREEELKKHHNNLEERIRERTSELSRVNEELKREVQERKRAEEQLGQRTRLLSMLLDVSNLVSSTLELGPLLEEILDRLKKIIDYKGAKVFVIEGETLKVLAHRSPLTEEQADRYAFHVKQVPLSEYIIEGKKPVVISDVYEDSAIARSFVENVSSPLGFYFQYIRSWMGIPLMVKDRVIGVLTLDHDQPGYYLPLHTEVGMAFANQAAIEFENARLYNETVKRADEIKTMFSVQQAITSRLDRETVLKLIADEARRLTDAERTTVFLVDGEDLVLSVFSGKDSRDFLGYRLPIGKSLVGQSLRTGKPVSMKNAQGNPSAYQDLLVKAGVNSFLSVPLVTDTRQIGAIVTADKYRGDFDADDERVMSMLGSIAVIGLENARMYQEERRRHQEDEQRRRVAEGLRDLLAILNSNRPLKDIMEFIIRQAVKMMKTNTGALYRYQKDREVLTIEAAVGLPEEYVSEMTVPLGQGVVGRAVVERKSIVVGDFLKLLPNNFFYDPGRKPHLIWLSQHYRALLAVPLLCKDEIYGGIVLYYPEEQEFSKDEIELAVTFADQAALAIDNARLKAQTEEMAVASERSRLARDLHDAVTQTLFSASLIAEVLPKIWEKNPDEGKKRLEELRQLAKGALAEMRTLLLELRPVTLVESSLKDLLTQLTQAVIGRARIPIALQIQGQPVLPSDVKIAFYRIAQEALNNIIKHSGATQVVIELECPSIDGKNTEWVEMCISDNGCGFEREGISGEHLGLGIMEERAQAVGAEIEIESQIGTGTRITVVWDTHKEESNHG